MVVALASVTDNHDVHIKRKLEVIALQHAMNNIPRAAVSPLGSRRIGAVTTDHSSSPSSLTFEALGPIGGQQTIYIKNNEVLEIVPHLVISLCSQSTLTLTCVDP